MPYGTVAFCQGGNGGTGSVDNQGTINVAAPATTAPLDNSPATVQVDGCSITDDTGGSIVNDGTFEVYGGNGTTSTYTQGNGSETGNPISLGEGTALAYTGTGASSVSVADSLAMTGNLVAGQNLTLNIGVVATEANSFTSAGQIVLNPSYYGGGGGPAEIAVSSGTFTNTGTITAESNDGDPSFAGNVVNDGTLIITPGTEVELLSGSFTNAASGVLEPEISSSGYSGVRIDSGTTFAAGGTLAPQLEGGFTPTVGQEYAAFPLKGGSFSGTFATVQGNWHVDYAASGYVGEVYGPGTSAPAPTNPAPTTPAPTTPAPTTPAPTTSKVLDPGVSGLTGGAGLIEAKLACGAIASSCDSYSLVASVTEHLKGTKILSLTALRTKAKAKTKVVTVASSRGSLKPGKSVALKLKLNPAGQALLKRYGKLKVSVVVSAGGKLLKRTTVTVTAPKAVKKKKK